MGLGMGLRQEQESIVRLTLASQRTLTCYLQNTNVIQQLFREH